MKEKRERESSSGFHFLNTFEDCWRKGWFKYILKWEPDKISPSLLFGQSIHHAIAEFYLKSIDIVDCFVVKLQSMKMLYNDLETYDKDLKRGKGLLDLWMINWGLDWKEREELLAAETSFKVKVGDFDFTGRYDGVFKDKKSGKRFIREIKTTSWSVMGMYDGVHSSDQPTAYLYSWNQDHPHEHIDEVQVDILYNRSSVYKCERPPMIYRSKRELEEWALGTNTLISEIAQRVKSLADYPSIQLFKRKGNCDAGKFKCPYRSICRTNIDVKRPPLGYHIEVNDE